MEERQLTKDNTLEQNPHQTQSWINEGQTALERIRAVARRDKQARFTSLLHHITPERLKQCFMEIKRSASPGIDGVRWADYEEALESNLAQLHARPHRGGYQASPSRRVHIPKPDGNKRPLGIATLEDKILQRAVADVLNAIYEVDFKGFSYGFRPKRNAHEALDALSVGLRFCKIGWVLDADIQGYFDNINHDWLMRFLSHRIADKRMLRLIKKWLKAGVIDNNTFLKSELGTPQGASISPLLSNIYLHYVLDIWAQVWREKVAAGKVIIIRWADDFVVGFQLRKDALAFKQALELRFRKFGLTLHPTKSRLIMFGRFARQNIKRYSNRTKPETFDFLGFTHCCSVNRNGKFKILRKTVSSRLRMKLKSIKLELKRRMHQPIKLQAKWLRAVFQGYMDYYSVPDNIKSITQFRTQLIRLWYKVLKRRSQRSRLDWSKMNAMSKLYLPPAKVLHPYPEKRFDVMIRGRSLVR